MDLRWAVLALCLAAAPAEADRPVVVELFTSQGCNACPPADRFLSQLATEDGVIPLAFHVDYWDYLGWTDTFGQRRFTQRQSAYLGKADRSGIGQRLRGKFTPEVVIQGTISLVGHDRLSIAAAILDKQAEAAPIDLRLTRSGDRVTVTCKAVAEGLGEVRVMVAEVIPSAEVAIARGENAGKTLTYHRVVSRLEEIGRWTAEGTGQLDVTATGPLVVFLQADKGGAILAAAEID